MRQASETNFQKISTRTDSDSTVLFDPSVEGNRIEIVHAAETPENSDLPAATETEDHLLSLSHSILEHSAIARKFRCINLEARFGIIHKC